MNFGENHKMKINQTPTAQLLETKNRLLKSWPTEYTIGEDGKKAVKTPGKGAEDASRHFTHICEEIARRGQL